MLAALVPTLTYTTATTTNTKTHAACPLANRLVLVLYKLAPLHPPPLNRNIEKINSFQVHPEKFDTLFTPGPTTYARAGRQDRAASRRSTRPFATAGPDTRQCRTPRAEEAPKAVTPLGAAVAAAACGESVGFTAKEGGGVDTISYPQGSPKDRRRSLHKEQITSHRQPRVGGWRGRK